MGKKHKTVNYVFKYNIACLIAYHHLIMDEMEKRNYNPSEDWRYTAYRGKAIGFDSSVESIAHDKVLMLKKYSINVFSEHNNDYLIECIDNLKQKGIDVSIMEKLIA